MPIWRFSPRVHYSFFFVLSSQVNQTFFHASYACDLAQVYSAPLVVSRPFDASWLFDASRVYLTCRAH